MIGGKNEHGDCLGVLQHNHRLVLTCLNNNMNYCILHISLSMLQDKELSKVFVLFIPAFNFHF